MLVPTDRFPLSLSDLPPSLTLAGRERGTLARSVSLLALGCYRHRPVGRRRRRPAFKSVASKSLSQLYMRSMQLFSEVV